MGSSKTDSQARSKFKKKLRSWGMAEDEIEKCAEQMREQQRLKKLRKIPQSAPLCTRAEYVRLVKLNTPSTSVKHVPVLNLGNDYVHPDDKGYKPPQYDSVLNGVARATGMTAKAVKRRKTMTKFQYDEQQET